MVAAKCRKSYFLGEKKKLVLPPATPCFACFAIECPRQPNSKCCLGHNSQRQYSTIYYPLTTRSIVRLHQFECHSTALLYARGSSCQYAHLDENHEIESAQMTESTTNELQFRFLWFPYLQRKSESVSSVQNDLCFLARLFLFLTSQFSVFRGGVWNLDV